MKAILFDNGVEVKRAEYPREDMQPITNLAPGLEWRLIVEDDRPVDGVDYDSLTQNASRAEALDDTPHPTYPHLLQYRISYNVTDKSAEELKAIIDSYEIDATAQLFPTDFFQKRVILVLEVLRRQIAQETVPQAGLDLLTQLSNVALKVWQNESLAEGKKSDVDLSNPVDPSSGWTTS